MGLMEWQYSKPLAALGRSPGEGNDNTPVFLPEESPWTEEPVRIQCMRKQKESDMT